MNSCAEGHPRIAFEAPACPLCAERANWAGELCRLAERADELLLARDGLSGRLRVNQAITDELVRENDRLRREHPGVPK